MTYGRLSPGITSRACRWGCGCTRSRWRWSHTRCTCWHRGHGGACAWASGCTPSHSLKSRTIRSASRRRGVHVSASVNGCNPSHSSCCRNICISYSCCFPLNAPNYTTSNLHHKLGQANDGEMAAADLNFRLWCGRNLNPESQQYDSQNPSAGYFVVFVP